MADVFSAQVTNAEIQWAGANPAQSHLAAMVVTNAGDVFWGAGNTLVGGTSIQKLMKSDVWTKAKVGEVAVARYTGFQGGLDSNGKMWFSHHLGTSKLVRYSSLGVLETETALLSPTYAMTGGNNMAMVSSINQAYMGIRTVSGSAQVILVFNINTAAAGAYNTGGAPAQTSSLAYDPTAAKIYGTQNVNSIHRYTLTPGADTSVSSSPDSVWDDFISVGSYGFACSTFSGCVKKLNISTMSILGTISGIYPRALTTDGTWLFVAGNGYLYIIDPVAFTIEQTVSGLVTETGAMTWKCQIYDGSKKTVVVSTGMNPGVDNVSFIDLGPLASPNQSYIHG